MWPNPQFSVTYLNINNQIKNLVQSGDAEKYYES